MKNCVCPSGQPGGLARRKTIFDRIRQNDPETIFIDCGELFKSKPDSIEVNLLVELYRLLDYNLVSPYIKDYALVERYVSTGELPLSFRDILGIKRIDTQTSIVSLDVSNGNVHHERALTVATYNYCDDEDEVDYDNSDWKKAFCKDGLDVVIIGGGGFIEPTVKRKSGFLEVYPGVYGEFVLLLELILKPESGISSFQWEAIPTESALPDSSFKAIIERVYATE